MSIYDDFRERASAARQNVVSAPQTGLTASDIGTFTQAFAPWIASTAPDRIPVTGKAHYEAFADSFDSIAADKDARRRIINALKVAYPEGMQVTRAPATQVQQQGEQQEETQQSPAVEAGEKTASENGFVENLFRTAINGTLKVAADIPRTAGYIADLGEGQTVGEGFGHDAANAIQALVDDADAGFKDTLAGQVGDGIGQIIGYLAGGLVGAGLKVAGGAATKLTGVAAKAAATSANATALGLGVSIPAASGAVAQVEDYISTLGEGEEVDRETLGWALSGGAALGQLERFVPTRLAKRFSDAIGPVSVGAAQAMKSPSFLRSIAANAGIEGATESVQQLGMNAIARTLYDTDRELYKGMAEAFVAGGVAGGALGGAGEGAARIGSLIFSRPQTRVDENGNTVVDDEIPVAEEAPPLSPAQRAHIARTQALTSLSTKNAHELTAQDKAIAEDLREGYTDSNGNVNIVAALTDIGIQVEPRTIQVREGETFSAAVSRTYKDSEDADLIARVTNRLMGEGPANYNGDDVGPTGLRNEDFLFDLQDESSPLYKLMGTVRAANVNDALNNDDITRAAAVLEGSGSTPQERRFAQEAAIHLRTMGESDKVAATGQDLLQSSALDEGEQNSLITSGVARAGNFTVERSPEVMAAISGDTNVSQSAIAVATHLNNNFSTPEAVQSWMDRRVNDGRFNIHPDIARAISDEYNSGRQQGNVNFVELIQASAVNGEAGKAVAAALGKELEMMNRIMQNPVTQSNITDAYADAGLSDREIARNKSTSQRLADSPESTAFFDPSRTRGVRGTVTVTPPPELGSITPPAREPGVASSAARQVANNAAGHTQQTDPSPRSSLPEDYTRANLNRTQKTMRFIRSMFSMDGELVFHGEAGSRVAETIRKVNTEIPAISQAVDEIAISRINDLERAVGGFENLSARDREDIFLALTTTNARPPAHLEQVVDSMRSDIDAQSSQIADEIEKVAHFAYRNSSGPGAEAAYKNSLELANKIRANRGNYVNRAYEAHINPIKHTNAYVTSVSGRLVLNAKGEGIVDMYLADNPDKTREQAESEVISRIRRLREHGGEGGRAEVESVLSARSDLQAWEHEMLGIITDPIRVYATTMNKMGNYLGTVRHQLSVFESMAGTGLIVSTPAAANNLDPSDFVRASNIPGMLSNFGQYYVHRDVADVWEREGFLGIDSETVRTVNVLSSHLKRVMTMYNPSTHVNNWMGNIMAVASNGNLNTNSMIQASEMASRLFGGDADPDHIDAMKKFLSAEGVTENSALAADMIESARSGRFTAANKHMLGLEPDKSFSQRTDAVLNILRGGETISQKVQEAYRAPDDYFRTVNFMAELRRIGEGEGVDVSRLTDETRPFYEEAARRTRLLMPGAIESPAFVKELRTPRNGVTAGINLLATNPFLTIAVGTISTKINAARLIREDLTSGVPWKQKRAIAMVAANTAVMAGSAVLGQMALSTGSQIFDDLEHKDAFPPYLQATQKVPTGVDEDNNVVLTVTHYIDHFSGITTPAAILWGAAFNPDVDMEDSIDLFIRYAMDEFGGEGLPLQVAKDIFSAVSGDEGLYSRKTTTDKVIDAVEMFIPKGLVSVASPQGGLVVDAVAASQGGFTQQEVYKLAEEAYNIATSGRRTYNAYKMFENYSRNVMKESNKAKNAVRNAYKLHDPTAIFASNPEEEGALIYAAASAELEALKKLFRKSTKMREDIFGNTNVDFSQTRVFENMQRGYSGLSRSEFDFFFAHAVNGTLDSIPVNVTIEGKPLYSIDSIKNRLLFDAENTSGSSREALENREDSLDSAFTVFTQLANKEALAAAAQGY